MIFTRGNEIIIIFSLISPYGNEANRGVQVRHHQNSVENTKIILKKVQHAWFFASRSILLCFPLSDTRVNWWNSSLHFMSMRAINNLNQVGIEPTTITYTVSCCFFFSFTRTPERRNGNINLRKYFVSSSLDRTHNQSVLQSHLVPLRHDWPQLKYFIHNYKYDTIKEKQKKIKKS